MPPSRKYRRRKKSRVNYVVLPVDLELQLLTLATETAVTGSILSKAQDLKVNAVQMTWALEQLTPEEGPIQVGYASGNLSVAEIKEKLIADPTFQGDIVATEQARRPVRIIGQFGGNLASEVLNDGKPIYTSKLRWPIHNSSTFVAFAYNEHTGSLTTGARVVGKGKAYCEWM